MTQPVPAFSVTPQQPIVNAIARAIDLALHPQRSDGLREALRQLCVDARRLNMRPEEVIIIVKARWRAHPELRALSRQEARSTLEHIIATCIEEYYAAS